MISRGIRKAMVWKQSCKTGSARYSWEGTCSGFPELLAILKLPAQTKPFKAKKFTAEEFQDIVGDISASARYSTMYLKDYVNVRFDADDNVIKIGGSYGV
jgi:hypothetical protein